MILIAACGVSRFTEPAEPAKIVIATISPSDDRIRVSWTLPEPVAEFAFDDRNVETKQRSSDWEFEGDGWNFDGSIVSKANGELFAEFSALLSPSAKFYRRKYVPLSRVEPGGWLILTNSISPKFETFQIALESSAPNHVLIHDTAFRSPEEHFIAGHKELLYFGPEIVTQENAVRVVSDDGAPAFLVNQITENLVRATEKLEKRLKPLPDVRPTVYLTFQPEWSNRAFKGGLIGNSIVVHIRGYSVDEVNAAVIEMAVNTAIHEAVHLWNGGLSQSSENAETPWLQEGSAEYIANRLWMNEEQFRIATQKSLNSCLLSLAGNSAINSPAARRGQTPYDCGHFLHLIAESSSLSANQGDVLEIWRALLEQAEANNNFYDSSMFLQTAIEFGGAPMESLIQDLDSGMPNGASAEFLATLNQIGVAVSVIAEESPEFDHLNLSGRLLRAIMRENCSGRFGYRSDGEAFLLDTGTRCGHVFSGDPILARYNGSSLVHEPIKVYSDIVKECRAGGELIFETTDGRKLPPATCPAVFSHLPGLLQVNSIPALPAL